LSELSENNAVRIDQQLVKALSHPIRVQILEALEGRTASPAELAREMDRGLGVISYHIHALDDCGCLELVRTKPRRGAVEHFFTAKPRSFIGHQDWRRAPLAVRGGITAAAFESFAERAAAAVEAGTIDAREDTTLSWMPMAVDDIGWTEIAEIMDRTLKLLMAVHAKSSSRLRGTDGIPVIVGLAGFEAGARRGQMP
jgi:DNA-binding transcriptional ArsR family regulator